MNLNWTWRFKQFIPMKRPEPCFGVPVVYFPKFEALTSQPGLDFFRGMNFAFIITANSYQKRSSS